MGGAATTGDGAATGGGVAGCGGAGCGVGVGGDANDAEGAGLSSTLASAVGEELNVIALAAPTALVAAFPAAPAISLTVPPETNERSPPPTAVTARPTRILPVVFKSEWLSAKTREPITSPITTKPSANLYLTRTPWAE